MTGSVVTRFARKNGRLRISLLTLSTGHEEIDAAHGEKAHPDRDASAGGDKVAQRKVDADDGGEKQQLRDDEPVLEHRVVRLEMRNIYV